MENLGKRTGTTDASIINRIQEMEERISGVKGVKSKKFLTQYIQEIWDTMKRSNLRVIGMEEGGDS